MATRARSIIRTLLTFGAGGLVALTGVGLQPAGADRSSGDRPVVVTITPCRLFDTRAAQPQGPRHTPLTAGETAIFNVRGVNGDCTIPSDALGAVMNVTVVNGNAQSYLTVFPSDATKPGTSNLNWTAGSPAVVNAVTVGLSTAAGQVSLYNNAGTVNVIADIVGYLVGHTHDDRYYTKSVLDTYFLTKYDAANTYFTETEVNTKLEVADGVSGWVKSNGDEQVNTTGFSSTRLGTGRYQITLPVGALPGGTLANLTANCAGTQCFPIIFSAVSDPNGSAVYEVRLYTPGGALVDSDFMFFVAKS